MNGILITLSLCFAAAIANGFYGGYGLGRGNIFLVTMSAEEKLRITACAANARNPQVCQEYVTCMSMMPTRVVMAYKKCRQTYVGAPWPQCFAGWPAFEPSATRDIIINCFAYGPKNTPEEDMAAMQFEKCARDFAARRCLHQDGYGLY